MSDTSKPQRRLILPEKKTRADLQLSSTEITVESVLNDALQTAAMEIARYRIKVSKGNTLDVKEARIIQGWIKTMVDLKAEQREGERSAQLDKLSETELFALAKKALGALPPEAVEVESDDDEQED